MDVPANVLLIAWLWPIETGPVYSPLVRMLEIDSKDVLVVPKELNVAIPPNRM